MCQPRVFCCVFLSRRTVLIGRTGCAKTTTLQGWVENNLLPAERTFRACDSKIFNAARNPLLTQAIHFRIAMSLRGHAGISLAGNTYPTCRRGSRGRPWTKWIQFSTRWLLVLDRKRLKSIQLIENNGAPGEIRTPDLLVRSQTLYPAELRARIGGFAFNANLAAARCQTNHRIGLSWFTTATDDGSERPSDTSGGMGRTDPSSLNRREPPADRALRLPAPSPLSRTRGPPSTPLSCADAVYSPAFGRAPSEANLTRFSLVDSMIH